MCENLQALREIEAMSGVPFLHSSSCNGMSDLFDGSPDDGLLSKDEDAVEDATSNSICRWPAGDPSAAREGDWHLRSDRCLSDRFMSAFQPQMTCLEASVRPASSPLVRKRGFDIAAS